MFRNYLTVAVRNLVRHKVYSFINISGLAIGMACFFLILCFVRFESSYDRHHEDADRIYRVIRQVRYKPGDSIRERVNTGAPLLPLIKGQLPGIEHAARLRDTGGIVSAGDQRFVEGGFFFADPELFQVFTLPLLRGNPETALSEPFSVVVTPETARRYFDEEDPLDRVLSYWGQDFKVTGVVQELPENSHFHVNFLASFASLEVLRGTGYFNNWDTRTWTYVKLREDHPPEDVELGLAAIADENMDKGSYDQVRLALQPLTSIHLHTGASVEVEMGQNRNPASLYMLSALGVVILLIACINFMSLATARSAHRAREVGMRKVLGGYRSQLIKQFLGESVLLSGIGLVFAFALVELLLPTFNGLVGKEVEFNYLADPTRLLHMIVAAAVVGLVAGSYPAFFLSTFQPAQVLRGAAHRTGSGNWFRKGLVVFQFVLSVVLIVSTILIHQQHQFLTNKELGFDKENVVSVPLYLLPDRARNYELFKQELLKNPRILDVTASVNKPGVTDNKGIMIRTPGAEDGTNIGIIYVDHDYLRTLKLELVAGRDFSKEITSDASSAILLNESALKDLGPEFVVGKPVELFWRQRDQVIIMYNARVIGVIRDFNHRPLYERPQPIVFAIPPAKHAPWAYQQALVRIGPQQIAETVGFIETQWKRLFPGLPFRFSFLDQDIEEVYRAEQRWKTVFTYAAALAIFVACLGLFGLTSFATEQRTKEIGVRKVLGASISGIVLLLSKEFTKLVIVSNLIAWPVAYWAMSRWLQDFAYRINLGLGTFLLAGVLALVIALLTVSFQAIKAALANPVEALRYE